MTQEGIKNDIDFDLVLAMDLEKYTAWLFSQVPKTRVEKKKKVEHCMYYEEKTISNYRRWIDEIFYKNKYWKAPTAHEIDSFPLWRKMEFDRLQKWYKEKQGQGIAGFDFLKIKELKNIIDSINNSHQWHIYNDIINANFVDDYYFLASNCGMIDHAKAVYKEDKEIPFKVIQKSKKKSTPELSFEYYLSEKAKKIYPALLKEYKNPKSMIITKIVYCLNQKDYINQEGLNNQSALHRSLRVSFGFLYSFSKAG